MKIEQSRDLEVLVLAPFGKDSALIEGVLRQSGIAVKAVSSVRDLIDDVPENGGAVVVAEESLLGGEIEEFARKIEAQPPWSDFPILVLTGGGISTAASEFAVRARAPLGNVTLMERPLRPATLISAVRSALTARRRQYEVRDHLRERQRAEDALRSARDALESIVEERTAALSRLSTQLLRVQDDERRRIARELHDSLGQYLAAAKINLDTLAFTRATTDESFAEAQQLIDRAISETRILSHLLHPPLLDATGFASAATWYVEGFGKRSGIRSTLDLPPDMGRLPTRVETALFRIMQEALTNVHRHAASPRVDVNLRVDKIKAVLVIKDFGKGISKDILERFQQSGTNVGVGLAGIRERVKELGGAFDVKSSHKGTTLKIAIPISEQAQSNYSSGPSSQMYSSLAS